MGRYTVFDNNQRDLNKESYPDLVSLNSKFYKRFLLSNPDKYNKGWTLFDVLFLVGVGASGKDKPYTYETLRKNVSSVLNNILNGISLDVINNLYDQLIGLSRAPNSYPFNNNGYSKYLIVTSLGGDIISNNIPDIRIGAFYMLTPENHNTNEIYERMSRELNNGSLYPESADVLFRYRSRIVLDLASESKFSFGGNLDIEETHGEKSLPENRINTNLFYLAFLVGKYFDTDRFFRQFPIKNSSIPYDPENIYTWVPRNIAMMIAHRRDIRSNLRLPVHELLRLEDEKDATYINRIKSGQINNEHMEEILLYFTLLGNDVEALSHLNMMDLRKILKLYVKIPPLEFHRERSNVTKTEIVYDTQPGNEIFYGIIREKIVPKFINIYTNERKFFSDIIGYDILVDYDTYTELLRTDYSILRSLYILKGCSTKRALLTDKMNTLIGLLIGLLFPIKNYQDRLYLTNDIDLLGHKLVGNSYAFHSYPHYSHDIDKYIYTIYQDIAHMHPVILKGLIEVNTNNVDSLARLYGISLEYLNYYDINPQNLPDQKVRHFRNTTVTMDSYFDRPLDRPELSLDNVKNINAKEYNDFELLELFNINRVYERQELIRIYEFIQKVPLLPILLQNETVNTIHILDTNTLIVLEVTVNEFEGRRRNMSRLIHNDIVKDDFRHFVNKYENERRKVFPGTALL